MDHLTSACGAQWDTTEASIFLRIVNNTIVFTFGQNTKLLQSANMAYSSGIGALIPMSK